MHYAANPASPKHEFSDGLGFLRGIAALVVVIFHALLVFRVDGIDDAYLKDMEFNMSWLFAMHVLLGVFNGGACVTLFFVLSGTVLTLSLERSRAISARTVIAYWVKRAFRLYPLLIMTAGIAALLQLYYFRPETFSAGTTWLNSSYKIAGAEIAQEFIENALGDSATLNGAAWSIKVEIAISIIFPALYLLSRHAVRATITLCVLIAVMFLWPTQDYPFAYIPMFLASFFIGASIPRWGRPLASQFYLLGRAGQRMILAAAILPMMFAHRLLAPGYFVSADVAFIETVCAALLVTVVLFGPDRPFYRSWGARTLGEISYGVYLLHMVVLHAIAHTMLPLLPSTLSGPEGLLNSYLLAIGGLAITLPLAYVIYHLFERPLQQFGRSISNRLGKPRPSVLITVAAMGPAGQP
jgi:peptidoglycan/LPS O-acetylase OafA/YrhL